MTQYMVHEIFYQFPGFFLRKTSLGDFRLLNVQIILRWDDLSASRRMINRRGLHRFNIHYTKIKSQIICTEKT